VGKMAEKVICISACIVHRKQYVRVRGIFKVGTCYNPTG
jgi:hypothetical protein